MMSWRPSWIFDDNENKVKSLGSPICSYSSRIGRILRKLALLRNTRVTFDVMAAILKIADLQL